MVFRLLEVELVNGRKEYKVQTFVDDAWKTVETRAHLEAARKSLEEYRGNQPKSTRVIG